MSEQEQIFRAPLRERVQLTLPWPPSVNAYWRARVAGKLAIVYTTHEAKDYRENVLAVVLRHFGGLPAPFKGDVLLDIVLHPPDARRRDADNFNKCVWDALKHAGVYRDDSQVCSYRVTKGDVVRGGAVIINIWERESAQAEVQG